MCDTAAAITISTELKANHETSNEKLKEIVHELENSTSAVDQQRCLKLLAECAELPEDLKFVNHILCYIFLTVDLKHPVKKTVTRILSSTNEINVTTAMTVQILMLISHTEPDPIDRFIAQQNQIILSLSSCFNNFPLGTKVLFQMSHIIVLFVCNIFMITIKHLYFEDNVDKHALRTYIYNSSKFLVALLNQCDIDDSFTKLSLQIMQACYIIITDESIPFNTRSNCGILFIIAAVHSPDTDEKSPESPLESMVVFKTGDKGLSLGSTLLSRSDNVKICIFSGILNVVPHEIICSNKLEGIPTPVYIFRTLLASATNHTGKPSAIVEISRTSIALSRLLFNMDISDIDEIFKGGLDYIWTHLEHFIDTVRHDTITVLKNFVKVAVMHEKSGHQKLMEMLIGHLSDLLETQNTSFKALMIISSETSCDYLMKIFPKLPEKLLMNMKNNSIAQQVCTCYEQLMEKYSKENPDKWMDVWVKHLVPLIHKSESSAHQYYQKIFIAAFKLDKAVIKLLTSVHQTFNTDELAVLLGCYISARKRNTKIISEEDTPKELWNGMLRYDLLDMFMCHQTSEIRILTLTLIIESQKTTEIFSEWDLKFLKGFLHYNITSQQPNVRQQIMALYKKALMRYKESLYVIERTIKSLQNKIKLSKKDTKILQVDLKEYTRQENYYKKFITDLFEEELMKGLLGDVNHPRRSNTLELLLHLEQCIENNQFVSLWKKEYVLLLYQAMDDSYETNIIMAARLLKTMPKFIAFYQTKDELKVKIESTLKLASSIKPTTTTSAAYYLEVYMNSPFARHAINKLVGLKQDNVCPFEPSYLLFQCIGGEVLQSIGNAKENILMASKHSPIYGLIFALRHLLRNDHFRTEMAFIVPQLIEICLNISEVASPIVNTSSPEGFMPNESEITCDETVTSQMILVYAWRTIKEISLLLGELSFTSWTGIELISKAHMTDIADYFINLFMETKHRGAYEQAYFGFSKFCTKLWNSNGEYAEWPVNWLKTILDIIDGKKDSFNKICSTRRSAGIPFMIQGILATEPAIRNHESFHNCMKTLIKIAEDFSSDNEKEATHSMNILRALYKHNQLGELVTTYVAKGVTIAIVRFGHPVWGVRNSATLMFSALMMRMFGVQRTKDNEDISIKNRLSAKVFFMRYPELYEFILKKLEEYTKEGEDIVSLFPILLILARLFPSGEKSEMMQYLPFINTCLECKIFKIRELAAQAAISVIPIDEYRNYIATSLETISKPVKENLLHGTLLKLRLMVKNLPVTCNLDVPDLVKNTFWILENDSKVSPISATLYMEILISFVIKYIQICYGRKEFEKLLQILSDSMEDKKDRLSTSGTNFELTKITLYLHLTVLLNIVNLPLECRLRFFGGFLYDAVLCSDERIQIYALNNMKYLLDDTYSSNKSDEDDEKSELEYGLIKSFHKYVKYLVMMILIDLDCHKLLTDLFFILRTGSKEYAIKVCSILPYLPCTVNKIRPANIPVILDKQVILDFLVNECIRADSDIFAAILPVISTLVSHTKQNLEYDQLIQDVLKMYSSAERTFEERLAVCNFLVQNVKFLYYKDMLSVKNIVKVWYIVITLLQDNDMAIRDCISTITSSMQLPSTKSFITEINVISEKSLEELLHWMPHLIPFDEAMKIYLTLALKPKVQSKTQSYDPYEIFDKGELNVFEEGDPIAIYATQCLKRHLWTLEDGLNYEDKSIFIEEHTLLVATKLFNLLYGFLNTYMRSEDKLLSMLVLKEVMNYLEVRTIQTGNFKKDFTNVLEKKFKSIFSQNPNVFKDCRVEAFLKRFFSFD